MSNMESYVSYLVATTRVMRDANKNGLFSFIDVFESLVIPKKLESATQSFTVAGKIYTDKAGFLKINVSVLNPKKEILNTVELSGDFVVGVIHISATFNLITFTTVGKHFLKVSINGKQLEDNDKFYFDVIKEK